MAKHDTQPFFMRFLDHPDDPDARTVAAPVLPDGPLGVQARDLVVQGGGRTILTLDALDVAPGEHVAIVGRSGAGKSTLIGLLLGWRTPSRGTLSVGGAELTPAWRPALRRRLAWVDPAVQLWNDALLANLRYGHEDAADPVDPMLEAAELIEVLSTLPGGLSGALGEGGGLLSGGQGQRVRLGRALGRPDAGLVLLDEAFRGLDRAARRRLLDRARTHWADATLLAVTHDVADTRCFPRVLVVEDGRILEDGAPEDLLRAGGVYARLAHDDGVIARAAAGPGWQHWHLVDRGLVDRTRRPASSDGTADGEDADDAGGIP